MGHDRRVFPLAEVGIARGFVCIAFLQAVCIAVFLAIAGDPRHNAGFATLFTTCFGWLLGVLFARQGMMRKAFAWSALGLVVPFAARVTLLGLPHACVLLAMALLLFPVLWLVPRRPN